MTKTLLRVAEASPAVAHADAQAELPIVSSPTAALHMPVEVPDRYELKYLIPDEQADEIRRAIEPYCALDPNCARIPGHAYGISSLYLDTPTRYLYRTSRERRARHWKARVRLYDGADRVFLELKNKDHDLIRKERARIPLHGWVERVFQPYQADATAAERMFCHRRETYGLEPILMVHYMREAWVSTVDNYARVTFDREVVAQPWSEWSFDADDGNWLALDDRFSMLSRPRGVVLELKCLTAVPRWLTNVVHTVGLARVRYSKYCKGIERHFARDTLLGILNQT